MSTKIRLARHGRKGRPFYHVVIADSRAPRDGRYIEKIGTYNPNTNPATIDLKFDRALYWLMTGAQPTDTASRILSYKGVLLKKHLLEGVKKGAFDEAAAEAKFEAWMKEKEAKIQAKIQKLAQAGDAAAKAALEAEAKVRAAKEEIIAKKKAELAAAEAAKKAEEEAAAAPAESGHPAPPCPPPQSAAAPAGKIRHSSRPRSGQRLQPAAVFSVFLLIHISLTNSFFFALFWFVKKYSH